MPARSIVRSLLAAPLPVKLLGANALIVLVAAVAVSTTTHQHREVRVLAGSFFGALLASIALNIALVVLALRPLRAIEEAAAEVWRGNTAARVPESMLADRDMARVGHTINLLVDVLVQDGERARELTAIVISQARLDQARVAHELHETAAQRLAAQLMQTSAIALGTNDAYTRARLEELHDDTAETLEQLRALVRTMNAPMYRSAEQTAAPRSMAARG